MEKPMFYQGQRVVCVWRNYCLTSLRANLLIEGKSYYIENPNFKNKVNRRSKKVYVIVVGISDCAFDQSQFIPYDTDKELENEIHEALKGVKIEKL